MRAAFDVRVVLDDAPADLTIDELEGEVGRVVWEALVERFGTTSTDTRAFVVMTHEAR